MAASKPLTDDMIDELPDDDPLEGFDLLEAYGIDAEGVETTADAQKKLREYLKQHKEKDDRFKCKECDLTSDDIEVDLNLAKACKLLEDHHISASVVNLDKAHELLSQHLAKKQELEEENLLPIYSTDKVAKVVQELVEKNRHGRMKLFTHCHNIQAYVESIPPDRAEDIHQQLPTVAADLATVEQELMRDDCTIMVAGETGSGKSCLLNLLLGELSAELMSVNNLPSTSALTEIKYDKKPYLKAHSAEGKKPPECVTLDRNTAPATIQHYTHQKGERTHFKYSKVEVFWPCDWIKNGITITDTPGVGENEELTDMVKNYIPKAYGFIYVINTPNAGGINPEELEDLLFYHITREGLDAGGELTTGEHASRVRFDPRSAIFVCNKWDQVAANERDEIKSHVKQKLKKVWRDFNFEHQVFFLSAKKTIEEVKSGYVSKEFRRLLRGIQNLLPVGFKTKLEKQFWTMFHVMDRCTWVLKSFIMCEDDEEIKQKKREQYHKARKRLAEIQKRPDEAKKEMRQMLQDEVNFALSQIRLHMRSPEAEERMLRWSENECPDNDNLERLHQLQNALAQKRIKKEINTFEQQNAIFEGIQKKLTDKFNDIFVSVESELASIEQTMKEESDTKTAYYSLMPGSETTEETIKLTTAGKILVGVTSPIWVPLSIVAGAFALPVVGIQALRKQRAANKKLKLYRENKPAEMRNVTKSLLSEFLQGDRLRLVLETKLQQLQQKFTHLLDRIPNLILANQKLVSELEKELDRKPDFENYIPVYNEGLKIQDTINYTYMVHIRTYDIDMADVKNMKKIGEGAFAVVYKGTYTMPGGSQQFVAVKRQKEPITEETATEFMTEELNLLRIQSPNIVKYLGASYKRNENVMYPVMVQEYCALSLSNIIYNKRNYQGPGSVAESHPTRNTLLSRAARYCDEISRALMAMHNMGMVHRDMKPENILVDTRGHMDHIKLCDLGISKREADIMMTMAGTPMYMAPEVLNEKQYNRSVDIFSLGLIVWEIWYGNPIEKAYTIDNYDTFRKKPFRNYKPPNDWCDLMSRCWSPDPAARPNAYECSKVFSKYYTEK